MTKKIRPGAGDAGPHSKIVGGLGNRLFDNEITAPAQAVRVLSTYDNGTPLAGFIVQTRDGRFHAFGVDNEKIGVFANRRAAICAIPLVAS